MMSNICVVSMVMMVRTKRMMSRWIETDVRRRKMMHLRRLLWRFSEMANKSLLLMMFRRHIVHRSRGCCSSRVHIQLIPRLSYAEQYFGIYAIIFGRLFHRHASFFQHNGRRLLLTLSQGAENFRWIQRMGLRQCAQCQFSRCLYHPRIS